MGSERAPEQGLRAAAAHGVRWSMISRPTVEGIQLGSIVVLARLIVPSEFGRFAIAFIVQEVAYLIVAAGISAALVQHKQLTREHQQSGMAVALLVGGALLLATLAGSVLVARPIFGERTALFVRLMAPLCLLAALNTVPAASLQRRMAFRRISEIEVLGTLARVAVSITLAVEGLRGEALVFGMLAGSALATAATWASAPPPLPRLRRQQARELLGFGLPVSLASISWVGFSNVDYAIIGARLGALETGFYYRAYTIAVEYQSKVSVVMTQVGFPVLARTRDARELHQLYRQMVRLMTILLFPLLVLLAIAAPEVVPLMFGHRWTPAVEPVQILALGGASTLVINAVGTVLMAAGRARALLGFGTAHFLCYGLSVLLVVHYGIIAVAIDAAVVHTLFCLVAYALMLQGTGENALRRVWSDVAPAALSCLGLTVVALPASFGLTVLGVPTLPWLAALGLISLSAYALTLRVCFPAAWSAQRAAARRIVPSRRPSASVKQRLAAADTGSTV